MKDLYQVNGSGQGIFQIIHPDKKIQRRSYQRIDFNNGNFMIRIEDAHSKPFRSYISFFNHQQIEGLLLELGFLANTIKREYGCPITCFIRYLEFCRSNRINEKNSSFGSKVYVNMLCSLDIDHFVLFDLHAPELTGFFSKPVSHVSSLPLFLNHDSIKNNRFDYVIAPDCGRADACFFLANHLGADMDFFPKTRKSHDGNSEILTHRRSHLKDKKILLFDDEITSGHTMIHAIEALIQNEVKEIHVAVIYSFCSQAVLDRIALYPQVRSLITTNLGTPRPAFGNRPEDYQILDCTPLYQFD
jgi:ribose-phosphate pyrophosphokinase